MTPPDGSSGSRPNSAREGVDHHAGRDHGGAGPRAVILRASLPQWSSESTSVEAQLGALGQHSENYSSLPSGWLARKKDEASAESPPRIEYGQNQPQSQKPRRLRRSGWEDRDFWSRTSTSPWTTQKRATVLDGTLRDSLSATLGSSPGVFGVRSLPSGCFPTAATSPSTLDANANAPPLTTSQLHDIRNTRRVVAAARDAIVGGSILSAPSPTTTPSLSGGFGLDAVASAMSGVSDGFDYSAYSQPGLAVPTRGMGSFLRTSLRYALQA